MDAEASATERPGVSLDVAPRNSRAAVFLAPDIFWPAINVVIACQGMPVSAATSRITGSGYL
jgi:hypothetical protein